MTARNLAELIPDPLEIAKFWANRGGVACIVQIKTYGDLRLIDVRKFYTAPDGTLAPTPKGVSLSLRKLPELASAVNKALSEARRLGLIEGEP
jgi:hypothetical protein